MANLEEHAKTKKAEPDTLILARLALDQYPLVKQVQSACDSAKFAAARLTGKEAPAHPDDEKTYAEVRARVTKVTTYLDSFSEKDFEGAETRKVPLPFVPGGNKGDSRRRLSRVLRAAQLLFPPRPRVRDPSPQRRQPREDGLHRRDAAVAGPLIAPIRRRTRAPAPRQEVPRASRRARSSSSGDSRRD